MTYIPPMNMIQTMNNALNSITNKQSDNAALFSNVLQNYSSNTIQSLRNTDKIAKQSIVNSNNVDLHELVTQLNETEMNLRLFITIKDKITNSMQEVMRMQI